jgi:hypothetical protein
MLRIGRPDQRNVLGRSERSSKGTDMRLLSLVLLTVAISGTAFAEEAQVEAIDVIGKGIYHVEIGKTVSRPDVPGGAVAPPVRFTLIENTTTVPARIGVEFGFAYRIIGEPTGAEVTLEFVGTYPAPGLADPEQATPVRTSRYELNKKIGEPLYSGYGFEQDWEVVPGTWTFEIWYEGRKLAEESFTVVAE